MKKHYDLILIDSNSLGYAAHAGRELLASGVQVQAIFFSLKMLKKAIRTFASPETVSIALWDHKANWRYDICPEYKGKRDDDPVKKASRKEYKRQVPIIRKAFGLIGLEQRFAVGEEADDLASAIVHARMPGTKILMISGDCDWLQMVNEDTDWYDPRGEGKMVTMANFEQATGAKTPVAFSQMKAILGDGSDNIKGVEGLGDKATELIFANWGSVPGMYKFAATFPAGTVEFAKGDLPEGFSRHRKPMSRFCFGDGKERFIRNMKLMNLLSKRHRGDDILAKQVICRTAFDEEAFTDFCHENVFMSIVKEMPQWQSIFA